MVSQKSLTLALLFAVSSNVVKCQDTRPTGDRLSSSSMGTGREDEPTESPTPAPEPEEIAVVANLSEAEDSASFAVGPSALMTTAALATTMLSYALN